MAERKQYTRPANFPTSVQIGGAEVATVSSSSTLTNKTLTSPTINSPVGLNATEVVITTRPIVAADSGKTFFLALANGFTMTLPTVATSLAGFRLTLFVQIAPTTAYILITGNSAEQVLAGEVFATAGTDEDEENAFTATTVTFAANTALIGDSAEVYCDGTGWYVRAFCKATGGITITG